MDITFEFKAQQRGPVHDACRGAVLFPVVKRARLREHESRSSVMSRYRVLHRVWRARAAVLVNRGWGDMDGLRLQYLRNCPPFSVTKFKNVLRPCHCQRVCPMCYARTITAEIFRCAEFALYMGRSKPMAGFKVVALKRTWTLGDDKPDHLFDLVARDRRFEVDGLETRGSAILTQMEVVPNGWKITRSVVAIMKDDKKVSPRMFESMKLRELEKTSKGRLASLVAWATKYPVGMLFGDDDRTVELLNASRNRQMFTTSGLMRNKKFRECLK
jgi:hypothetical protein